MNGQIFLRLLYGEFEWFRLADGARAPGEGPSLQVIASLAEGADGDQGRIDAAVAAISDEIRKIQTLHHERGPASARTVWHEDVIVCVLEEVFTPAEEALVGEGRFAEVRRARLADRDALEPTYRALIETVTDRTVRAYMTEVVEEGVAFEAFMLGP
jgi:uncharacterized protein YbcI